MVIGQQMGDFIYSQWFIHVKGTCWSSKQASEWGWKGPLNVGEHDCRCQTGSCSFLESPPGRPHSSHWLDNLAFHFESGAQIQCNTVQRLETAGSDTHSWRLGHICVIKFSQRKPKEKEKPTHANYLLSISHNKSHFFALSEQLALPKARAHGGMLTARWSGKQAETRRFPNQCCIKPFSAHPGANLPCSLPPDFA